MNRDELVKLAIYQRERMEEMEAARKKEREDNAVMISGLTAEVSELNKRVSGLTEMLRASNQNALEMSRQISELLEQLKEKDRKIEKLQVTVKSGRKNLFGRKSQKGTKVKDKDDDNRPTPHIDVKDGFDGTPESLPQNLDVDVEKRAREAADGPAASKKESRLYRLGKTYRTMTTDNRVLHRSDTGKLHRGCDGDKDLFQIRIQSGDHRDRARIRDSGLQGQGRQCPVRLLPHGRREGRAYS